mmetsp:Transcript_587/g.1677  ORF Transcript_587/g.1677 Transcript_587/m.1677 type:complete len:226 (-) Transcript_587:230-907(-)
MGQVPQNRVVARSHKDPRGLVEKQTHVVQRKTNLCLVESALHAFEFLPLDALRRQHLVQRGRPQQLAFHGHQPPFESQHGLQLIHVIPVGLLVVLVAAPEEPTRRLLGQRQAARVEHPLPLVDLINVCPHVVFLAHQPLVMRLFPSSGGPAFGRTSSRPGLPRSACLALHHRRALISRLVRQGLQSAHSGRIDRPVTGRGEALQRERELGTTRRRWLRLGGIQHQ